MKSLPCNALLSVATAALLGVGAWLPAHAVQTSCNDNGGAGFDIPVDSTETIPIDFGFADEGVVKDVNVFVDITHPYVGDLSATVTNPEGTASVLLFHRPGLPGPPTAVGPPYGCDGDNIITTFDDESPNGRLEDDTCDTNPAYGPQSYTPHNEPAANPLSDLDNSEVTGVWDFTFVNSVPIDTGTMNEACITVRSAAVTFDQWVSTSPTCADTVDSLNEITGTDIYTCYVLSNPGDEAFTLGAGDWSNNLGHDLSGLQGNYNPGDSQTVVAGPEISGTPPFPVGTTNGISEITIRGNSVNFPPVESITTDESVTLVIGNAPPASGNKLLYFYDNQDLERVVPTTDQGIRTLNANQNETWVLSPSLQSDLDIDATGGEIPVSLFLRRQGFGFNRRDVTIVISGSTSGEIARIDNEALGVTATFTEFTVNVPITGATALVNGEEIRVQVINATPIFFGSAADWRLQIDSSNGASNHSRINLPSNTVINVDDVGLYNVDYATDPAATPITGAAAGSTVYVRSTVSDPFGSFDITAADITLTDAASTVQVNAAAMTEVQDSGAATKIYEYSYTVPAFPAQGNWRADVTAQEGTEGTVEHNNFTRFSVFQPPSLSVTKSSDVANASPGDTITYTVSVTNSGNGIAKDVYLEDTLSPYIDVLTGSFACVTGCPGSGVTLGTVNFTTDVAGDITAWDVMMSGDMNPSSNFALQYQATVE
ncbi:MAG: proprotein convertase P-domain-containing protein [Pseudomonadota bacterium]